ncbi:MAG: hypothetical protein JKY01_12575 [Pseudomonadales bacterium]|nr:hypothetical protein [Pseudomonadales bacterium]
MIFVIEIELIFGLYAKDVWQVSIELDSATTLEDLHFIIQEAVEFDNDHMYKFYISRTERSRDRVCFDDENEKIYSTTLENLYPLEKDRKLYYMFDYGDGWLFKITKSRKSPQEQKKSIKYPRIVNEVGKKPEQYPEWED